MFKPHSNDVRERKLAFEIPKSDAFAAPGFHLDCGMRDKSELILRLNSAFRFPLSSL